MKYLEVWMFFGERSQVSSAVMFIWFILTYFTSFGSFTREKASLNPYTKRLPCLGKNREK